MHYICTKCGYESIEYSSETHPCPCCGENILLFHHIGVVHKDHWVVIDVNIKELIGEDLCNWKNKES